MIPMFYVQTFDAFSLYRGQYIRRDLLFSYFSIVVVDVYEGVSYLSTYLLPATI